MATRLFVGNLPENTSETALRSAFSSYGEITTLDLKSKNADQNESKKFAFVSLAGSNYDIEACIKHFSNQDFNGHRLYVTRARESFLERLQKEREQAQQKETQKQELPQVEPHIKHNEKLNPLKRNFDTIKYDGNRNKKTDFQKHDEDVKNKFTKKSISSSQSCNIPVLKHHKDDDVIKTVKSTLDQRRQDSENKRMESMKKKRQEFKEKKMIIKTGLTAVDQNQTLTKRLSNLKKFAPTPGNSMSSILPVWDKVLNTKIVFGAEDNTHQNKKIPAKPKGTLFEEDDSGDDVDFSIKEQFEGKKGQKVLDLQSRYKSDKRFTLDKRFIEDEDNCKGTEPAEDENENVELEQKDEKNKQLDILQDVLGITLKRKLPEEDNTKIKPIRGMLRFDPSQPDHAKFLAPMEPKKQEITKKGKKKLKEKVEETQEELRSEEIRPEVSKEQFYNVTDALKEAIAQPTTFSLRSLFGNTEPTEESKEDHTHTLIEALKKPRVKNPLESKEKNPFVYDSSESENEDEPEATTDSGAAIGETKAVWKENLFFSDADLRLKEGLAFFNNANEDSHKERRELKSLVKKRIYNKERKNQMFKKKIGGRRKTMKKSFRKKT